MTSQRVVSGQEHSVSIAASSGVLAVPQNIIRAQHANVSSVHSGGDRD